MRKRGIKIVSLVLATALMSGTLAGCKSKEVQVTTDEILAKKQSLAAETSKSETLPPDEDEEEETTAERTGPENQGELPEGVTVNRVEEKQIESTIIEDDVRKEEIINQLREKLKEQKSSYKMDLLLNFELIKLSKTTGDGPRYYFTLERERRQNKNKYYSHIINSETYAGSKAVTNTKTYLLDNGEKTFSYSKEFDSLRDVEDRVDYLGAIVDRDLESEIISFEQIDTNLILDVYEVAEEKFEQTDCYTLKCLYPLPRALELIGINPIVAEVDEENSKDFKATVKLYVNRSDYDLIRFEVTCMNALEKYYDSFYNNEESEEPWKMEIHKCNASVNVGSYNGVKIEIPKEIEARLPEDLKKAANNELGMAVNVDDKDSITLDGDFAIGVSDDHKVETTEESVEGSEGSLEESSEGNEETQTSN